MNFGGVIENVITREEFPLSKALETLKDETIAVIGYGVQGPGQSLNLKDNGFNVIVGQRKNSKTWDKAVADGWVPGKTLFEIEEACERATIIQYLLSDAAQIAVWPSVKKHLTPGKALYFSHGFGATYSDRTGIVPPKDIDVIMIAPKGSGTSLRRLFLEGRGLNSSYAVMQDATGRAMDRVIALGIGVGSGYLFETTFKREVYSDLTGERGTVPGAARERPYAVGSLQRDGRGTDPKSDAAGRRERYGLDVRQLLDDGSAGRARLVEAFPRCDAAGIQEALCRSGRRQRGSAFDRLEQQTRLSREVERGAQGNARERNVAGRRYGAQPASRKEQIASFLHIPNRSFRESGRTVQQVTITCCTVHVDE